MSVSDPALPSFRVQGEVMTIDEMKSEFGMEILDRGTDLKEELRELRAVRNERTRSFGRLTNAPKVYKRRTSKAAKIRPARSAPSRETSGQLDRETGETIIQSFGPENADNG